MDIALASTLRDGLLRRSEAAALRRGDVELLADGSGRLHVRQSKGDQEGSGAVLYLGPDAVRDLLAIRPPGVVTDAQAPVFGLSASQIGRRPRAAAQLHDHLAGPVSELFVAASALPVAAFRGRQHGEKGQGPIASRPGDMAQPHQGDPAQATGLDQVAPAGTHRIAVDAQGFDFRATAPFQGFVDAEDQRTIALIQVLEHQHEQDASRLAGRPHRPIEHLMIAGVVEVVAAAPDAPRRGHGALARGQYGAGQQDLGFQPGRGAKQRGEGMSMVYDYVSS